MNILFMSLGEFKDLSQGSVHIDVIRELSKKNEVFLVCKNEKREGKGTTYTREYGINVLRVQTGNIKKVNLIRKGISTISVEHIFCKAIKKYFADVSFDSIIYTTPPITFVEPIQYIKKKDNAFAYLMLKDIFPQNAVDLEMLNPKGAKSLVYNFFRRKEKKLYKISDCIGCMSPANKEYVLKHNTYINDSKVEIFPNCISVHDKSISENEKRFIREKYGLPQDKIIFIYGGNLGKPQGINYLKKCLLNVKNDKEIFFLIVGGGTEYEGLRFFVDDYQFDNVSLLNSLPKNEYEILVSACDIGMIFLDHRFTIPNFPARTLSYMQSRLPVFAMTDKCTDLGDIIVDNGFGWWAESKDVSGFISNIEKIKHANYKAMGDKAYNYCIQNYNVEDWCNLLIERISKEIEYTGHSNCK